MSTSAALAQSGVDEKRVNATQAFPTLFIIMWSSGYIAGAIGIAYTTPFVMTTLRFSLAAAILFGIALATKAPWPRDARAYMHLVVVGILIQAIQFGGLYSGMKLGVSAGVAALIIGTMPAWAALGASAFLKEKNTWGHWVGLLFGLTGVAMVVGNRLIAEHGTQPLGYVAVAIGLAGITSGSLYQKRFCVGMDLRTGGFVQLTVAAAILGVLAFFTEPLHVAWTGAFLGSLTWMSLVNSIGAISVFFVMMRQKTAGRVTSLFHLIPPVTAVMAALVLHEIFTPFMMLGFAVAAFGVYLSSHK